MDECQGPILEALAAADLGFGGLPKSLGNECDAHRRHRRRDPRGDRGQTPGGRVRRLGGRSGADVRAPAVAVGAPDSHSPGEVLTEMAEQRVAMGLAPRRDWALPERPEVVPVVAVQRGASPKMVERMLAVRDALASSSHGFPPIKIYEVSLIGELLELDESRAASGSPRPLVSSFVQQHDDAGKGWKARTGTLPDAAKSAGTAKDRSGAPVEVDYALPTTYARHNLLPEVRDTALRLFDDLGIAWHQGKEGAPSPHLRSSQVQCVNALGQMVHHPDRIAAAFGSSSTSRRCATWARSTRRRAIATSPSSSSDPPTRTTCPRDARGSGRGGRSARASTPPSPTARRRASTSSRWSSGSSRRPTRRPITTPTAG